MKTVLHFLFLLLFPVILHAQNVVVKDSSSLTFNGQVSPADAIVGKYTYNTDCQKTLYQTPTQQILSAYYPDGKLYQQIFLTDPGYTGTYTNQQRTSYSYDAAGNAMFVYNELWNSNTNTFEPFYRDSLFYNSKGLLSKHLSERYHQDLQSWTAASIELSYYNDPGNTYDSMILYNFPNIPSIYEDSTVKKSYYTYDTQSDNYTKLSNYYYYSSGSYFQTFRERHFIDSVNYIKRDSSVIEYPQPQPDTGYFVSNRYANTYYYNTDETLKQENFIVYYVQGGSLFTQKFFTYGSCSSALPVTFLSFSGLQRGNDVVLKWQTANENNTLSFGIQRSADGVHFITIGNTPANCNGCGYTYLDKGAVAVPAKTLYYRLAERDRDGSRHYSNIATLNITSGKPVITVSPNPVTNIIHMYSSFSVNNATLIVSDMRGKTVYTSSQNLVAGSVVDIDASAFAKGVYIITVRSALYTKQLKIVKE